MKLKEQVNLLALTQHPESGAQALLRMVLKPENTKQEPSRVVVPESRFLHFHVVNMLMEVDL